MKNFKKAIALLLAAVLLVAASVMGTIAYLTDVDKDINVMSAGNVEIVQNETNRDGTAYTNTKTLLPAVYNNLTLDTVPEKAETMPNPAGGANLAIWGDEVQNVIDKVITVTNSGSENAYVRTILLVENTADNAILDKVHFNFNDVGQTMVNEGMVTIESTSYTIFVRTYTDALEADKVSAPSLMQVYLDPSVDNAWYENLGTDGKFSIIAFSQATQKQGFGDAVIALNAAFGGVTPETVSNWMLDTKYTIKTDDLANVIS